jgi:hypothetical protein
LPIDVLLLSVAGWSGCSELVNVLFVFQTVVSLLAEVGPSLEIGFDRYVDLVRELVGNFLGDFDAKCFYLLFLSLSALMSESFEFGEEVLEGFVCHP